MNEAPTLKRRHTVFENRKLRVFSDNIEWGDHHVHDYMVVAPVAVREDKVAGVAIVFVVGDEIVLVRMYRHALGRSGLEVPRGFVEPAEDLRDAATRELAEEARLECDPNALVALGFCSPEPGIIAGRIAMFAAPDCQPCPPRADIEPGLGPAVRFHRDDVFRRLRSGEIEDSTSALALLRWFTRE